MLARINGLLREITRHPFTGTGKPEPLKNSLKGWWSRRITQEHRLTYRVIGKGDEQAIEIAACRFHYSEKGMAALFRILHHASSGSSPPLRRGG